MVEADLSVDNMELDLDNVNVQGGMMHHLSLSRFLPFTLYPFWTGVRVIGNPYLVITR